MFRKDTIFQMEVAVNTDYGGFSINTEMALWLMENRGWVIKKDTEYDYKKRDEWPLTHLVEGIGSDWYYHPNSESIRFRSQPDLLDCIRAIKKVHENDTYPESYYGHIHDLNIAKVSVYADIENYHDGKERVNCWADSDYEDD